MTLLAFLFRPRCHLRINTRASIFTTITPSQILHSLPLLSIMKGTQGTLFYTERIPPHIRAAQVVGIAASTLFAGMPRS